MHAQHGHDMCMHMSYTCLHMHMHTHRCWRSGCNLPARCSTRSTRSGRLSWLERCAARAAAPQESANPDPNPNLHLRLNLHLNPNLHPDPHLHPNPNPNLRPNLTLTCPYPMSYPNPVALTLILTGEFLLWSFPLFVLYVVLMGTAWAFDQRTRYTTAVPHWAQAGARGLPS